MSARKTARDAIIVAVIVIAAVFLFHSRAPGPVERAQAPDNSRMGAHDVPPGHFGGGMDLSEGEPVVTLGDSWIGKDWLLDKVETTLAEAENDPAFQEMDDETVREEATGWALIIGLMELTETLAIEESGIQADPEAVAEQEREFFSSFQTEQEAQELLRQMGFTMEQVRAMWEREATREKLRKAVAEEAGVEAGTEEADGAYGDWLVRHFLEADFVFQDSKLEGLYASYRESLMDSEALEEDRAADEQQAQGGDTEAGENGERDDLSGVE